MTGTVVSHYKILEKLGEGGMGVVYKARDTNLDRIVALKFLPTHLAPPPEDIARFKQEAKAISSLNHPHIATIHDIDETSEQKFLAMEYLAGGTLKASIKRLQSTNESLPFSDVVEYGIQIAEGLAHAHRHGIIHRDIKTDNLMLTADGTIKITDFGLAKFLGDPHLTTSGTVVGTAAYMSPEQIRGDSLDERADLFSLGVVLYELASGRLPFRGDHSVAVSYSIVNEDPIPLNAPGRQFPPSFERLIHRCLEKDKAMRYQNAGEIAAELRNMRGGAHEESAPVRRNRQNIRRTLTILAAAVMIIGVGVYGLFFRRGASPETPSIAVLPFKNLTANIENEYLSDGMTDEVIAQLAKLSRIQVISRTSAMHYKNSEMSLRDIGRELNVTAVLEGSVRRQEENIVIVAQLIDAQTDRHLWGDSYDEKSTNILAVQRDVAEKIAKMLDAKISPHEQERLEKAPTENLEAYDAYLKGRYHWSKRLPNDLRKSIEYFEEALSKDPGYARAFAGLADAYIILGDFNILPPSETYPKAKEAALKALAIDAEIPEAHTSLAYALLHYDRDWPAAEKEFKRALELAPNSAQTHSWYAIFLSLEGRHDEAVSETQRARALDPFSAAIRTDAGLTLYFSKKYDAAIDLLQEALTIDPTFVVANVPLGGAYTQKKMYPEAITAFQQITAASSFVTSTSHPVPIAALAYVYGVSGRKDDAIMMLELLEEKSKEGFVSPYWLSVANIGIGNTTEALKWLDKACQERDGSLIFLKADPIFDTLRSDPRFLEILKK